MKEFLDLAYTHHLVTTCTMIAIMSHIRLTGLTVVQAIRIEILDAVYDSQSFTQTFTAHDLPQSEKNGARFRF